VGGGEVQIAVRRATGKQETLRVKVPAGIEDGKKIRLRGQGEPGQGGSPAGDILIRVRILPHPHFRRKGKDLEVRVPVTLAEAAAGTKVDVPAPRGMITMRVPPGTSSGKRLRAKGQGIAPKGQTPGDLFAEILIVLPEKLDAEDKQLLEKIANKHPQNPRAELSW
jgi:bacterioferritin-associated ferredoxin